ncbi:MAG: hypothetical protein ACR2K0_04245 [Acidimicrobiales bacterium]
MAGGRSPEARLLLSVAALVVGVVVGWGLWRVLQPLFGEALFARENYRGALVPTAVGLVLALAAVLVAGAAAVADGAGALDTGPSGAHSAVLAVAVGLALLGLVDDLVGTGADGRGFRGHLAALAGGRLTTGGVKLLGGGALALAVCAPVSRGGAARLLADALLVALAANLGNLFDRAPGRSVKVGALAFVVLALATGLPAALAGVAVVVGAALALLPGDLGERLMLGDTGANALGGVLGLGAVVTTAPGVRLGALAVVVALNVAGEVVSFSRIIDDVRPLRALDRAGRRRPT